MVQLVKQPMRIYTFGDVAIDSFAFIDHGDVNLRCRLNTTDCEIAFQYGDKIPVKQLTQSVGGNAANVAVGMVRCGLDSYLSTAVGDDESGKTVSQKLRQAKVNLKLGTNKEQTNQSFIILFRGERTIFSYHEASQIHLFVPKNIEIAYLTSLSGKWKEMYEEVCNNSKFIIYQPGTAQIRAGYKKSKEVIKKTDLLILNKEEAAHLLGQNKLSIKELLHALLDLGAKEVVITEGKNGSHATNGHTFFTSDIWHGAIRKESTGSGDGFATGYCVARLKGRGIEDALRFGTINAGCVMQKIGAQEGLQTWESLECLVKKEKVKVRSL